MMTRKKFVKEYEELKTLLGFLDDYLRELGLDPTKIPQKEKYDTIKLIMQRERLGLQWFKIYAGWIAAFLGVLYAIFSKHFG